MHWFLDPIQNHYADFKGRATRREFWMFTLYVFIVYFVGALILGILSTLVRIGFFLGMGIWIIATLALLIPSLAFQVRRLHDTGRSGWWLLISFIPYVGGLIVLVLECLPSQKGTNIYGPNKYELAVAAGAPLEQLATKEAIVEPTTPSSV